MPELPEVEVVRRGLASHVVGRTFEAVHVTGERAARRHPHGREHLAELLTGTRVVAADRRGKYLWLVLAPGDQAHHADRAHPADHADPFALIVHLGMSGQMLVEPADAPIEKHAHALFWLREPGDPATPDAPAASEPARHLRFVDQRTFGGLAVSALGEPILGHPHGVPVTIAHIAPDPLEEAFDADSVVRRIRASTSGIKRSLLNQNVVSGVGNIYADESLWRAGIHGERPGSALTKPAVSRLLSHAQDVMEASLEAGGTSFDSLYVNVNGASGYFSRSLDAYGREGRPCNRCGRPIRRETFMNRSSYSCPKCQRRPRLTL
ncbi:MAG: bifunctional DNA-formamidopyrimidine glycosylase/DNA-(apurinic or apyrimidinic site) lyase [Dermatophilus congolensis]|nr:bifunctional DNA-formamidopyrimidine glycosylase/DNA-(apurinic or apyrimidinic site) lyase [Dermatophilus congolensis]